MTSVLSASTFFFCFWLIGVAPAYYLTPTISRIDDVWMFPFLAPLSVVLNVCFFAKQIFQRIGY